MNENHTGDHDLLIEIKTKVMNLTDEVRLMRDDTKEKIKGLETNKLDLNEFRNFKLELSKDDLRLEGEMKDMRAEISVIKSDIEKVFKYMYMAMGALAIIQIVMAYLLK